MIPSQPYSRRGVIMTPYTRGWVLACLVFQVLIFAIMTIKDGDTDPLWLSACQLCATAQFIVVTLRFWKETGGP